MPKRKPKKYTCDSCRSTYFSKQQLDEHLLSELNHCKKVICPYCFFVTQNQSSLKKHLSLKVSCSRKYNASVNSGILSNPSSIFDMQKQRNKRKFTIAGDEDFSSFSKDEMKSFYDDIRGQLSGNKARIIYDNNTNEFQKIGNGLVNLSTSKKQSGAKFISSNRNIGCPDVIQSANNLSDRASLDSNVDYIVISSNVFNNVDSKFGKNKSCQTLEKQITSAISNDCAQNTNSFQAPFIVIPINSRHVDIAMNDSTGIHQFHETELNETVFENDISQNNEENYDFDIPGDYVNLGNMPDSDNEEDLPFFSDLNELICDLRETQKNVILTDKDYCLLDLLELMIETNSSRGMFDKIIDWTRKHKHVIVESDLDKRKQTMEIFNQKLYGYDYKNKDRIPKKTEITMSSGRKTSMTTMSFQNAFADMITSPNFIPKNLNIDPSNPNKQKRTADSLYYGEPNSGTWSDDRRRELGEASKKIYVPFTCFVDGLKVDKFGKLSIEAVLACCLWYNRKERNREENWFSLGFIEDQKLFKDTNGYVGPEKYQDYHDMISHVFREFKEVYDSGGWKLDLQFNDNCSDHVHENVRVLPIIQYFIGDCKNHDVFCGRVSSHNLNTPWLCRDCNCPSMEADNKEFMCRFVTKLDFMNKTDKELKAMSHHKIKNAFYDLPLLDVGNVHTNTPPEALHAILLGPITYLNTDLSFTKSGKDAIISAWENIYPCTRYQSERDMPSISTFRHGLDSVKGLKADERFERTFAIFLSLMNSSLIKKLQKITRKGADSLSTKNARNFLFAYKEVVEDSLLFYMWAKKDNILKSDVNPLIEAKNNPERYNTIMSECSNQKRYKKKILKVTQLKLMVMRKTCFWMMLMTVISNRLRMKLVRVRTPMSPKLI